MMKAKMINMAAVLSACLVRWLLPVVQAGEELFGLAEGQCPGDLYEVFFCVLCLLPHRVHGGQGPSEERNLSGGTYMFSFYVTHNIN